ncbi:MAG: hypothetical protein KAJ55_07320 [Anaerolineales bacterium]|nr:hypothetical protein [Anaerolineales bacterium]
MKLRLDMVVRTVRADFELHVDEHRLEIRIVDKDLGGMSVTNDLERVLALVATRVQRSLEDYEIFYRDSTGTWDLVIVKRSLANTFTADVIVGPRGPELEEFVKGLRTSMT